MMAKDVPSAVAYLLRERARTIRAQADESAKSIEAMADAIDLLGQTGSQVPSRIDPPTVPAKPDGQTTTTGNSRKERKG